MYTMSLAALNKLIAKLDHRADKAQKASPSTAKFTIKERVESIPSTTSPPKGAPLWAIRDEYRGKDQTDNPGEEELAPPTDPLTPASSHSSEISSRPRRILGETQIHQDFDESDLSSSSDESIA